MTAAPDPAAERGDLAALHDLARLRDDLLARYAAGDEAAAEQALQAAVAVIATHPRLCGADRQRLITALRREYDAWFCHPLEAIRGDHPGSAPWPDFVAALPVHRAPEAACASSPPPERGAAPAAVHWNTRLLDGERAVDDLLVCVGHDYTVETGLDPVALADALGSMTIASELPDRTSLTFELSCPLPILRLPDDAAQAARVVATRSYDAATRRCPPARFVVAPVVPGRIPLTLSLVTGNAIRASIRLALQAERGASPAASAGPPPGTAPAPVAVSAAAVSGPPAQLRLTLTPSGQLVLSDGVMVEKPRDPASPASVLHSQALLARRDLVALSRDYRRDPGSTRDFALSDAPAMRLRMAKIGAMLHRRFFGRPGDSGTDRDVQHLAQVIADTPPPGSAARLQIAAVFQPYPWAVFYDGAYRGKPITDDPASVDLDCFWGCRFQIDRMIMGHARAAHAPVLAAPVRVQACVNRHLDDEPGALALGVQVVARQRALFDGIPGVVAHPRIETASGFLEFLDSQTACDLLYMFCHATAAATRDELFTYSDQAPETGARLIIEPPPAAALDIATMQDHRIAALCDRPLVFLNACSTAAGDEAFQAPLLEQFLDRWGAAGVVGTDWEVPSPFADAFSHHLLDWFLRARRPLGKAFWLASQEAFAEGNPFPLVYALYAQPELAIAATSVAKGQTPCRNAPM